jgi:hypothetical protein
MAQQATMTAVNIGGNRTVSSMPTMAANKYKHENSYFLHNDSSDWGVWEEISR